MIWLIYINTWHMCVHVHTHTHTHYPQNLSKVLSFNNLSTNATNLKKTPFQDKFLLYLFRFVSAE